MGFALQAEITNQINSTFQKVRSAMPAGEIPEKEGLADLKGIFPNPKTCKNTLACNAVIPLAFLSEFNPLQDLVTNIGIPQVPPIELGNIEFKAKEPKIEPEIDVAKLKSEGFTDEQIAEEQRKREARQKRRSTKIYGVGFCYFCYTVYRRTDATRSSIR